MPLLINPPPTADDAYTRGVSMCQAFLSLVQDQRRAIVTNSDTPIENLVRLFDTLRASKDSCSALISVPGLDDKAKSVMGSDFSISEWFTMVLTRGTFVTDWIIANLPGDLNGGIVTRVFVPGAQTAVKTMGLSELSPLVTLLDDLIAALEA